VSCIAKVIAFHVSKCWDS